MTQGTRRTALAFVTAAVLVTVAAWMLLDNRAGGEPFASVSTLDVVSSPASSSPIVHVARDEATTLQVDTVEPVTDAEEIPEMRSNHPALRVSGRAVDSEGAPIAGARFTLASGTDDDVFTFERTADPEGRVSFDVPGAHAARMARRTTPETLVVTAKGHIPHFTTVEAGTITHLAFGDVTLAPGCQVTGRIVTAYDQPVAGATVTSHFSTTFSSSTNTSEYQLAPADHTPARAAGATDIAVVTDERGRFTIVASTSGVLFRRRTDLVVTAEGFAPLDVDIERPAATEAADLGDIVLAEGASVHGAVVTENGTPVADACVFVSSKSPNLAHFEVVARGQHEVGGTRLDDCTWWTRTDERGAFRINRVAQREQIVRVFATNGRATRTKVHPGGAELDIVLTPFESVTYQCIDELTGTPVTPSQLVAFDAWSLSPPFADIDPALRLPVAATDDGSRWVIEQPAKKTPQMHVELEGYLDIARVEGHTLFLQRQADLDVHVTTEDGTSIENAKVTLASFDERGRQRIVAWTFSHVDGLASLANVPAGDFTLIVSTPGFVASRESIVLVPGPTTRHVQLAPASQLVVHIRDADGEPVPAGCTARALKPDLFRWNDGATIVDGLSWRELPSDALSLHRPPIEIARMWTGPGFTSWTGPGTFVFSGLAEGSYHLAYDPGGIASATVTKGETTEVVMTLRRWPLVSGLVVSKGQPVSGATVVSENPDSQQRGSLYISSQSSESPPRATPGSTTTDALGRWSMPVLAGERYITAKISSAARTESLHTFEYDESYELVHEIEAKTLRGIVVDTTGAPVHGADVSARPGGGSTKTDAEGRFILPWASLDVETVRASHADYLAMPERLAESEDEPMRIVLTRGAQVTCHFEDANGQRFNPAKIRKHTVSLQAAETSEAVSDAEHLIAEHFASFLTVSRIATKASSDGTHVARGVPPGRYRVSVRKRAGRKNETVASKEIEVIDASSVECTLVVLIAK